jgi:hypothetical protein
MAVHFDEGLYKCRITQQALVDGEKKSDGKETAPSVQITVLPIGFYDSQGNYQEHDFGWERTIYLYLTPETVGTDPAKPGWVLETLRYLGFNGASFALLDPTTEAGCDFRDKEVDCLCRHDEYQGKQREKWSIFRPREKKEYTPPAPKVVRTLDAKFGKLLKSSAPPPSHNGHNGTPAAPPTQQVATPAAGGQPEAAKKPTPEKGPKRNGRKSNGAAEAIAAAQAAMIDNTPTTPEPPGPTEADIPF